MKITSESILELRKKLVGINVTPEFSNADLYTIRLALEHLYLHQGGLVSELFREVEDMITSATFIVE